MTDLIVRENNLPTTPEDLSAFVLFNDEKVKAVRAALSAMHKLKAPREVLDLKLREAQELSEQVTLAKMELGKQLNEVPKAGNGGANQYQAQSTTVSTKQKPKSETIAELGLTQKQAEHYQLMAKNSDAVHAAMAKARENDDVVSQSQILNEIKQTKKETRQEVRRERKTYTPPTELPADKFKLIRADIRDGLPDVADNSVDFIITDPPYPKEFLPLYADLSKVAARVLKDGGSLICMTGQSYLPDVIQLLSTEMRYHWCLSYLTPGGQSAQLFQRRVNTFWKPVLWFVKGDYSGDWIGDVLKSSVNDNDKRFHEWGQSISGMKDIVERLTNPDDTILDPFLGGGTTGLVAVTSGRKFIGVDIEQRCIDTTLNRIREVFTVAGSFSRTDGLAG